MSSTTEIDILVIWSRVDDRLTLPSRGDAIRGLGINLNTNSTLPIPLGRNYHPRPVLNLRPLQYILSDIREEVERQRAEANQAVELASEKTATADDGETALRWLEGMLVRAGVRVEDAPAEPQPDDEDDDATPSGRRAVRLVMAEDPEREWSAGAILAVLKERGWLSPHAKDQRRAVENALRALEGRGEIERVREGRYVWRGEVEPFERE
jgi:hypothetical protein